MPRGCPQDDRRAWRELLAALPRSASEILVGASGWIESERKLLDVVGVDCRHLDAYSYGLVEVNALTDTATVTDTPTSTPSVASPSAASTPADTPVVTPIPSPEPTAEQYAQGRTKYVRSGGGTPPPGATPVGAPGP